MATYILLGKYALDSIKQISAKRTDDTLPAVKQHGGTFKGGYATLGDTDLLLIVELPGPEQAMQVSVALSRLLGVSCHSAPAVSVEEFDRLVG
jgi:uncharacterized protein with GYD domain